MKSRAKLLDTLNDASSFIYLLQMACSDMVDEQCKAVFVATEQIAQCLEKARSIIDERPMEDRDADGN